MDSDNSLTPELIQNRSFSSAFRGYDPAEVRAYLARLAAEVRHLRERADQLESAWRSAEERAARPPVLDEDTLMAAVGEDTAAILRAARAAAADIRAKAGDEAERTIAGAKARAEEIRAEAEAVLETEKRGAHETATRTVEAARAEAAEVLDRARADGDALRAKAEQERALTIEGAASTRERILDDLARRRRVASVQIEQLRAGRERLLDAYGTVRRTLEEAQEALTRADADARAAAEETGRRLQREQAAVQAEAPPDDGDGAAPAGRGADETVGEPAGAAGEPAGTEGAPGSQVDVLFARIRGGRSAGAESAPTGAEAPAGASTAPGGSEPATESGAEAEAASDDEAKSDADEALLQQRESAIADLDVTLTRKLKRTLQDEQNGVLDRLRNIRGEPTVERLLPDQGAQLARYAAAAEPFLTRAATAGAGFAAQTLGTKPSEAVPAIDDIASEAATAIVDTLRRRLEQVITSASGDDQQVLVQSIGSAYREWKSQRVERIVGDAVVAAFARGTWHEAPEGTLLRWIVEDVDGPCPDCDDDALAGSLAKGDEPFPTGQRHPPAHSGCRCLLVPVAG